MPKATLEFSLPEEREEYETTMNAACYYGALFELYTWLRQQWKYDAGDLEPEVAEKVWQFVQNELGSVEVP